MNNKIDDSSKYDDIINLPHHISKTHPHMSMINRAAQFAPFAALPGHEDAIQEEARIVDKKIELDENDKQDINEKLLMIEENINGKPFVSITYFKPDKRKDGGEYLTFSGYVKKIDKDNNKIKMTDGTEIEFDDIIRIEGDLFPHTF